MAEWSKALRSGRSLHMYAWVRIPLLTKAGFEHYPSVYPDVCHGDTSLIYQIGVEETTSISEEENTSIFRFPSLHNLMEVFFKK